MSAISTTDRGVEILTRTIKPAEGNLPIEAARAMLSFRLSPTDWERVNALAAKARAGTLTVSVRPLAKLQEQIYAMRRQQVEALLAERLLAKEWRSGAARSRRSSMPR